MQRAMQSRCCWPPERPKALSLRRSLTSSQRAEGDVVVDRLREGIRFLEDHPDQFAHLNRVNAGSVEVLAVVEQLPLDFGGRNQVVHPVEAAQQGALAAAGRADHRSHFVAADLHRDPLDRGDAAVGDVDPLKLEDLLPALRSRAGPEFRAHRDLRRLLFQHTYHLCS
jgi:hypothetical protein